MIPQHFVNKILEINENYINGDDTNDNGIKAVYELICMFDDYIFSSDIFNQVDDSAKNYKFIDEVFSLLDGNILDEQIIVGVLSASCNMKGKSINRDNFIVFSEVILSERLGEGSSENILIGFK